MRYTVEARADRWQRRHTGPWITVEDRLGPVVVTRRYRRRSRIEFVRLSVALHDLERAVTRPLPPWVLLWCRYWAAKFR
jgi:hypothetical protein